MNDAEKAKPRRRLSKRAIVVFSALLLGCGLFVAKALLFPEHPSSWYRIHATHDLPLSEVRDILSHSGASLVSTARELGGTTETWRLQNHFGAWTVLIIIGHYPSGDRFTSANVRYDSTIFPHHTRVRTYPNY